TDESPADNAGSTDAGGGPFGFPDVGTKFVFADFPPGGGSEMHATDTIDYIVVVAGEVVFVTETGEKLLRPGDTLGDRGILHAWRNEGRETCRIMSIVIAAHPVGNGATV